MPNAIFLIPGYGAQGGTIADIRPALRPAAARSQKPSSLGVLVTASRSVIYPPGNWTDEHGWRQAVATAADALVQELRTLHA